MKTKRPLCFRNVSTFLVLLLALTVNIFSQQHYNFNSGGGVNTFPFGTLPATGKTVQYLFLPGDFNNPSPPAAGNITKYYVRAASNGNATYTTLKIRMGLTTDTDLPPTAWYTGAMTTVFNQSNFTIGTQSGNFVSVTLDTPFLFDPTKSLVVEIEQCGYSGTGFSCFTTPTSGTKRHTGPLSATSCPHPWGNTGAFMMHTGIDIAPPVINCSYSWSIQTSGTTALIYSVKAVSNLVGWAAGAGGVVRRTVDGVTWTNGNPNPGVITGDIYNIEAIDANTAWVTTTPGATFIYKTINGGTTWVQVFTLAGGFINTIKMVSSTNGYAFGDVLSGTWVIRTTVDGGTTWPALPTAPAGTGDGRNNCLHVSLPNMWFGTGQATVVRSNNAGTSWIVTPATGITGQVTGIQFNTSLIGLIGGATMSKTIDGGGTYALLPALGAGTITGIEGSGSNYWYTRGTGIFYSTNDGVSWTQVHTQTAAQNDISLVPDGNGCMVGWSAGTGGTISKLTGMPVGINDPTSQIPSTFKLEQNYPNPFNPTTNITFALPIAGNVELKIYDVLGREVASVLNAFVNAGTHTLPFDASSLASGVYIYKITSGSFTDSKKMALIK